MKTFRCVRCDIASAGLRYGFFAVQDTVGRNWVCREEQTHPDLIGRGWEGWAHHAGIAATFAQFIGDVISEKDPFEDVRRVMDKTVTLKVADESALPDALAACKG